MKGKMKIYKFFFALSSFMHYILSVLKIKNSFYSKFNNILVAECIKF